MNLPSSEPGRMHGAQLASQQRAQHTYLLQNIVHFGRVLRHAGMPVPTDRIQLALTALQVAGLESRRDFHDTLAAC